MDSETLERKFYSVLGDYLGHSDADLDPTLTLEQNGADALDALGILMSLEEEFHIMLADVNSPGGWGYLFDEESTVAHCLEVVKAKTPNH